jgi:hypothetical protein
MHILKIDVYSFMPITLPIKYWAMFDVSKANLENISKLLHTKKLISKPKDLPCLDKISPPIF